MKTVLLSLVVIALTIGEAIAYGGDPIEVPATPTPCIDTTTNDTNLWIQVAGDDMVQPQQVFGAFTSWDPSKSTVGFKSALSQKTERIPVRSIRFEYVRPNPAAQMPIPRLLQLGRVSRIFPANGLAVVSGILKPPGCHMEFNHHRLAFDGSLTFTGDSVGIEGVIFEIEPPPAGDGDSTRSKGN